MLTLSIYKKDFYTESDQTRGKQTFANEVETVFLSRHDECGQYERQAQMLCQSSVKEKECAQPTGDGGKERVSLI